MNTKARTKQLGTKGKTFFETLQSREEIFQQLADNIIDGVYCINADGYFIFVNKALAQRTGIRQEQFPHVHFLDLIDPAYHDRAKDNFQGVMEGKEGIPYELRYKNDNGPVRIVEVHSRPIFDRGKVVGILGISRDVTERKRMEEELRASEQKFRSLIEKMPIGIVTYDGAKFQYVNPLCEVISGYTQEELYRMHVMDVVKPEFRGRVKYHTQLSQKGKPVPERLEFKILTKTGEERWLERVSIELQGEKEPLVLFIVFDITDRKQAEKAFQESEERFRLAAESSADLIWEWDIRTGDLAWFGPIDKALGYEAGEFPRTIGAWESIIHPDDHTCVMAALDRHLKDRTPYDKEYRVLKKDGRVIYWADRGCAVWNQEDEPWKMVGAVTDITDRKRADEELRENEERFRQLADATFEGIVIHDKGEILDFNLAMLKMFGYERDEVIGKKNVIDFIAPESRESVSRHIATGYEKPYEVIMVKKDGNTIVMEVAGEAISYKGKMARVVALRDITERRCAEEILRKSEEKYRALLENASDPILLADEHGNLIEANRMAEALLGYPREELLQMHYAQLHPKMELEKTITAFKDIVTHGKGGLQNGAILRKDGMVVPVDITANAIEYGGRKNFQASFRDISEHKQAEDTLERLVNERTVELFAKNKQLVDEIKERRGAEAALRRKGRELQLHSKKLEELNTALKVLLKRREEDKTELEEKIVSNVKELVEPYVNKLKKTRLNTDQSTYVNIIETHLNGIISPFVRNLASKHPNLTSRQIQIAELIMADKTTKEIAVIMNSSKGAIDFHRNKIRTKLGLKKRNVTLRSYLLSIS